MSSIGILHCIRKRKRGGRTGGRARLVPLLCVFAASVLLFLPHTGKAAGDVTIKTPSAGAEVGKDPTTGTRTMKTPDPKPQEEYKGPQTVIVSPEVYPNRPGHRPPLRPQPR